MRSLVCPLSPYKDFCSVHPPVQRFPVGFCQDVHASTRYATVFHGVDIPVYQQLRPERVSFRRNRPSRCHRCAACCPSCVLAVAPATWTVKRDSVPSRTYPPPRRNPLNKQDCPGIRCGCFLGRYDCNRVCIRFRHLPVKKHYCGQPCGDSCPCNCPQLIPHTVSPAAFQSTL